MKIVQFCLLLRNSFPCEFFYADPEEEFYTFKPFPPDGRFQKNILYILADSDTIPTSEPCSLLVYREDSSLSALRAGCPRANLICARRREGEPLSALYGIVSDIFLMENRFTAQVNRLSHISSSNRGMQAVIDEAARILEAPIVVMDSSYGLLASSNCEREDDETNLREQLRIGALTARNLERMKRDRIFEQMRRNPDRIHFGKAPDAHHWWVNLLIYVHGVEVAEVGVMEDGRKFNDYDFELMKYLRHLIALEIQRGHSFGENYSVAHNLLVSELLDHSYTAVEVAIRHRSSLLGWAPSPFYSILAILPESGESPPEDRFFRQGEILAAQISHYLPKAYWRVSRRDLAFLIPHGQRYMEEPDRKLGELLKVNHMTGILGNPVESLMDVRKSYEQALDLYRVREYFFKEGAIHRYCDHTALHIASILYRNHALEEFYHPYVLALRDYDRKNHTDFLRTLYHYLTYIDDPTAIAKQLHIHKNTLYYRLNKLRELFPIDLNDGHVRLCLQLTMEMMRLEMAGEG